MTMSGSPQLDLDQLDGRDVIDPDGDKVGTVADIYYDKQSRDPEWVLVATGMFGGKHSFVPLAGAIVEGDTLRIAHRKDVVKDAPRLDDDGEINEAEEAELARHYAMTWGQDATTTGTGAPAPERAGTTEAAEERTGETVARDTSGPETDRAMTRSEEELRVGTQRRPSELVRLRKEIVTENVTTTVPVEREVLRVEREPITDGNVDAATSGADLTEEAAEITLSQEEVVIDKKVVPKERVRLDKDVVVEERQVDETVRKEQIEVDEQNDGTATTPVTDQR